MFAPCRKMGVGGYKEYLLISQRTSLFFKADPSEKGKMRLRLAMADIHQILPHLCLPQQWMSGGGSLHGSSWNNTLGWAAGQPVLCRNAPGTAPQRCHLPRGRPRPAAPPAAPAGQRRSAPAPTAHPTERRESAEGMEKHTTHASSALKKPINQKLSRIFCLLGV